MEDGIEPALGFAINDIGWNEKIGSEVLFYEAIHCVDHLGKVLLDRWEIVLEIPWRRPSDVNTVQVRIVD